MKLLADANIEAALVRWLRSPGHDVVWAADMPASTSDVALIESAGREERLLLAYDRGLGELVFLRGQVARGIILLRLEAALQVERLTLLKRHWASIEVRAQGHFMVVSERNIRVRPMP